jgi:hypothetical protein|tara:strand:- start:4093 stop:4335 length:243 start_codon:yes stop_codon:yes gene_type:complete
MENKTFMDKVMNFLRALFHTEYEITIYRQSEQTGQMYKSHYVARKILIQKEKHLKFRDWESKKMIEVRASSGLDYKIEEK